MKRTRNRPDYAQHFPALSRRRRQLARPQNDFSQVWLGHDQDGRCVLLDERTRTMHMHVVGTTGSAKTTLLKHMLLQDFRRGRGGLVIDPHGSHPDSLYHSLLAALAHDGFLDTGRVVLIDPNVRSHLVPINFLARVPGIENSVLSDALVAAVSSVWEGEDLHAKPTTRSKLKAVFTALADLELPLSDARLLLHPNDPAGVRVRAIERLTDPYAREELESLHLISLDGRSKRDFRAEVVGPLNRLAEFCSSLIIRTMLGIVDEPNRPRRTLDLLGCMNRGDIILFNAQHGEAISEADASLLGALLLRYLVLLCSRRTNFESFYVTVDECHRFLKGASDVPDLLAEGRKFGCVLQLSHQFLRQLGTPDDLLYQAVMNCPEIRVVFRVKSPKEAQELAEYVLPLSLERPVLASVRKTVVGHQRVNLTSRSRTESEAVTEGEAETVGEMHAHTDMESHSEAVGTMTSTMTGAGSFDGIADSTGMVLSPPTQFLGPNAPNASFLQYPLSESLGQVRSHGSAEQSGTSSGTSHMSVSSHGTAKTYAQSRAATKSAARSRGTAHSVGDSEAFEPIYADLPSAWHSKEHELYRAGELIRALPTGRAFVSFGGKTICISIPKPKE